MVGDMVAMGSRNISQTAERRMTSTIKKIHPELQTDFNQWDVDMDTINLANGYIMRASSTSASTTEPYTLQGGNSVLLIGFSVAELGVQMAIGFGSAKIAVRNKPFNGSWSSWNVIG